MTPKELLEKYYEQEMNEVFRTSDNYLMSRPRKGCEKYWHEAFERADALMALMSRAEKETER